MSGSMGECIHFGSSLICVSLVLFNGDLVGKYEYNNIPYPLSTGPMGYVWIFIIKSY